MSPSARTIRAVAERVLEATQGPAAPPAPWIMIAGERTIWCEGPAVPRSAEVELENGTRIRLRAAGIGRRAGCMGFHAEEPVPVGVHRVLEPRTRGAGSRVDVPPRLLLARPRSLARMVRRAGRRLGVFLPLHSIGSASPVGVGTFGDLRALCAWSESTAGALFGTLPLFPSFLDRPFDPSPYAPISRLMWNELLIDPRECPEWRDAGVQRVRQSAEFMAESRRACSGELVDYRRSWKLLRRLLKPMSLAAAASPRRWSSLMDRLDHEAHWYALFRAAVDATGRDWTRWPRRAIDSARLNEQVLMSYWYAQAVAREQVESLGRSKGGAARPAGRSSPLYLDLPVGVHAGGFDTWCYPGLFLGGLSAGAPPDPLNPHGQVWGFPPMHPTAGRADGYAHLRRILSNMFSIAGVLRIDHVMGLYRMYCVPEGAGGNEGAYVRYPEEELFAVFMIEAARAGALVVGENLGAVPPEVRAIMRERSILGMHVQQFAISPRDDDRAPVIEPAGASDLVCLNTHDMPPLAGYWSGADIALRRRLGLVSTPGARRERLERSRMRRAARSELKSLGLSARTARDVALSISRLHARGPAPIALVNLEDLWGERRPQNVPGTSTEHPNWRRRSARSLARILSDPAIVRALRMLARERRRVAKPARRGRP
ncbi:MAG: 4-alpha-glucanotransferase [Phycisphaerales bacterium]